MKVGFRERSIACSLLKLSCYVGDGLCVMIELATTTLTHQVSCVVFVKLRLEEKKKKST
jgi:hypothetical protein